MAVAAAVIVVSLGVLFLLSGLIVNAVQAVCFVVIRPISKGMYRKVNKVLEELLWRQLIWLADWWAGIQVRVYGDEEAYRLMGNEHALLICNHRSDIDWLVGWMMAERGNCLGSTLAVMKKSIKFLPVIGWSMWFAEYLFLERSWTKDEKTLKSGLQSLRDYPQPFWLALFVEGTRFTQSKLLAAQEYAASQKLPIPRNVLIPRTKGFVSAVSSLRSFVPAIYDITVAIPKDSPQPTMLRILKGKSSVVLLWSFLAGLVHQRVAYAYLLKEKGSAFQPSTDVHIHMKRHNMKDLPDTDEAVAQWCRDVFVAKDSLLDKHNVENSFGGDYRSLGRPVKSLLVITAWSSLLLYSIFKFFKWSSILSTWKGIAFSAGGLLLVTGIMYVFILFSQSERSTPGKVAPSKAKSH